MKPVILKDDDHLVGLLRGERIRQDITQRELDERIGWEEGYCTKVEAPRRKYGKRVSTFFTSRLIWLLDALGLAIVLVDKRTAAEMVAASVDPEPDVSEHRPYPNRNGAGRVQRSRVYRLNVAMVA
jgi:hypothetical protein